MAPDTNSQNAENPTGRAGRQRKTRWYVLSYPLAWLVGVFLVPLSLLVIFSFWVNIPGGQYEVGLTLENYRRFLTSSLYLGQFWLTIEISIVTAVVSLFLGYPLAYYLARVESARMRNVLLLTIVSSLWITYVIRAYAWQVILASGGILSSTLVAVGVLPEPRSFFPGYWGMTVGMVYVFLPFMVLTLYTSIRNIDEALLEASKNLGAGPLRTFRRVTLPLSKNGIVSGTALVFILAIGAYVIPRLLGGSSQRTLPVLIEQQIMSESNYPFGAAMSIGLIVVVLLFLWLLLRLTEVTAADVGGTEALEDEGDATTPRGSTGGVGAGVRAALGSLGAMLGLGRLREAVVAGGTGVVETVDPRTRERVIATAFRTYVGAVMAFVAVPLAIIVAVSLTPEEFLTFPPGGISARWYVEFFTNPDWTGALANSLFIATAAALLATSIGGVLAFALDRFDYPGERVLASFGVLPILIPPVIIGVAFLVFFLQFGLTGSRFSIIVAHGIFYAPFPFILITQGLGEIDRTYEEAAMNLGAAPLRTIRTITYPLLRTNVISGALFAFILSLNEYIIAWLLSLFLVDTIPIQIFNQLRYSYPPTIAAASTVFIVLTVIVMTTIDRLSGGIWE
ncbi:MAG: ABC transporter permease subunit [Halanaeroarchaeum sp.]